LPVSLFLKRPQAPVLPVDLPVPDLVDQGAAR
jgi:hypothetical protein